MNAALETWSISLASSIISCTTPCTESGGMWLLLVKGLSCVGMAWLGGLLKAVWAIMMTDWCVDGECLVTATMLSVT